MNLYTIQAFIYFLGNHLGPVVWRQKKEQQFIGLFFWSFQKNPITAVFGDQRDYSVSKKKQSEPIWFPALAEDTSL